MHQNKWPDLTGVSPGREKKVLEKTYVYYILLCIWDIEQKIYIMYIYKYKYIHISSLYMHINTEVYNVTEAKYNHFTPGYCKWLKEVRERMWDRHRGTIPAVVVRMILLPRPATVICTGIDIATLCPLNSLRCFISEKTYLSMSRNPRLLRVIESSCS